VWFSPYPLELTTDQMRALFADCAHRAERLRAEGAEVVFVTGVELRVMNRGFVAGDIPAERGGRLLADPAARPERVAEASARLNQFLRGPVATVRARIDRRVRSA